MALLYHSISPLAALLIISSSPMSCRDPLRDLLPSSSVSNRARSRGLWLLKVDRSLLGLTPENQKTVNIDSENIWKPKFLKFSDFLLFYKFWITSESKTKESKNQTISKIAKISTIWTIFEEIKKNQVRMLEIWKKIYRICNFEAKIAIFTTKRSIFTEIIIFPTKKIKFVRLIEF